MKNKILLLLFVDSIYNKFDLVLLMVIVLLMINSYITINIIKKLQYIS